MRFFETSMRHTFTLLACVALTTGAVICVDESSVDKTHALDGKVNELQRNATAMTGADETTEIDGDALSHTEVGGSVNGSNHRQSQVTQFLQTVQDTLEKAKPWVVELEKEAKRLEETAKRFGEGVIRDLGSFVDRLIGGGHPSGGVTPASNEKTSTASPVLAANADDKTFSELASTTAAANVDEVLPDAAPESVADVVEAAASAANDAENEISGQHDDEALCPDGFVADINGICLRNHK